MSPTEPGTPPADPTAEPKKARPKLELPSRVRKAAPPPDAEPTPPPDAEPAAPPPDATPASPAPSPTPDAGPVAAPVEAAPSPTPDAISDTDLTAALAVILDKGVRKTALQSELGISPERAAALLTEMEAKGIIAPAPTGKKKREILLDTWPPVQPFTEMAEEFEARNTANTARSEELEALPEEPAPGGEPAPGTEPAAETVTTTPETAATTPETPAAATESKSGWESIKSKFTGAYDRFMSKFRGEVQPQDEKEYKASWGDVAKNAATGFLSVVGSYTGLKIIADLPQWIYQKWWTNPAERERLKAAFASKDTETGVEHATAVDQRKARLEQAINESKFLSKEKRAELLARLQTSVESYKTAEETARAQRNEDIAKLLDQAIETRVKNTQVLKEALNSALMVTGLSAMRGVAYGSVAVYERYKEVTSTPEGRMHAFKRTVVDGFTETVSNIFGGKAETWTGKGMNFVKGATNVLRAAGFADLAIAEWTGEGRSISSVIETSLKAWEDKGAAAGWDNFTAPSERLLAMARGDIRPFGLGSTAESTGATGPDAGAPGAGTPETAGGAGGAGTSPEAAAAAGAAGAAGVAAAESAPSVEIPEATVEAGLVKKGDGILKILERQGVEAKSALEAAREAGIVRAGGDTRLTTEAIGRLSVFAETQPDGDIEIKFFDSETDKLLTLEEAREAGFTYESGTVPGEIPTDKEIVEHVPEPTPDVEALVDSPAPNDLLGGTFHLYTDAEGHFTSLDPGDGDMLTRMNDALQELSRTGHGESPEAKFIFEQYKALLSSEGVEPAEDLPPAQAAEQGTREVQARVAAEPETPADSEPLRKFKGEAGRVKFIYDKDTGEVKDAFMPAYTPRPRDIEDSLREWGLTNKEVKAHFFEGASRTHMDGTTIDTSHPGRYPGVERTGFPIQSPENDYRQFVRDAERLSRQESLLEEMEMEGYARTPEYARLRMETETLEKYVAGSMTRQFNIKEREI